MNWKNHKASLFEPVNATNIDIFRRLFAICLFIQSLSFYSSDLINLTFVLNKIRIPFDFASWLPPLPGKLMNVVVLLQLAGAVLLFTRKYARIGALIFFLSFGYLCVLDISYYNNHFYFILLLCLFFIFYKPIQNGHTLFVPKILALLFQFQVVVVYFFGGVSKLTHDWLFNFEPMREILHSTRFNLPGASVCFFVYGGLIFDLTIGFLLLYHRTLKIAVILTVLFHLLNYFMFESGPNFDIGIFPFLMISANLLFIDPVKLQIWISNYLPFYKQQDSKKKKTLTAHDFDLNDNQKKKFLRLAFIYVIIQLLLPLRHYAYKGNVDWTSEGYFFAWRMKIRSKTNSVTLKVKDGPNGKLGVVNPYLFLNTLQYQAVCDNPGAMYTYVQQLKKKGPAMGVQQPQFYLSWKCSMNGHPAQLVVDSTYDFGSVKHNLFYADDWIAPFKEIK